MSEPIPFPVRVTRPRYAQPQSSAHREYRLAKHEFKVAFVKWVAEMQPTIEAVAFETAEYPELKYLYEYITRSV